VSRDPAGTTTVYTEGGLLPPDLLTRIARGDPAVGGLGASSYHLPNGETTREAITRSWARASAAWASFVKATKDLPVADAATGTTRDRWLLVLFGELGYGRLQPAKTREIDGRSFPISHFWDRVPIHLVGRGVQLDRRAPGVAGAARVSPHGLVQDFLNRSDESLWGFVSNGLILRLLRDNASLTRQAYVEFDLEAMMSGEAYADFTLLWMLCHQSRVEGERREEWWLERWALEAREQGTRALEGLRRAVEQAITALGAGFLAHPVNTLLKERLRTGGLSNQDYYRQILRLVYRFIFLFVAEDRDVLLDENAEPAARERYTTHYSTSRLRRLAARWRGGEHADLYRALQIVMDGLGSDTGCAPLGLAGLGGFLWSPEALPDLHSAEISNRRLLTAVRSLTRIEQDTLTRPIDFRNLGSEELGSVYESLLELHPRVDRNAASFELTASGRSERKTTGSYYTPPTLVQCLLDSVLDPVLDDANRDADPERAILALKICDPACGSGHFLIAAAHRIARRLAMVRSGGEEPSPEMVRGALRDVVGRCLHGVDQNPMAVELCKVSLWMEAVERGRPLPFLENRILCGNSLIGATPVQVTQGIPDDAFKPIEGDDKKETSRLRRRNREERKGQTRLPFVAEPGAVYETLADAVAALETSPDETLTEVHLKEDLHRRVMGSPEYMKAHLSADVWCAAFVWRKTRDAPPAVTHDVLLDLRRDRGSLPSTVAQETERLARQYGFFHWHLAFPHVFRVRPGETPENEQTGWSGGFDVVLGNPPWGQIQLDPQEFFDQRSPDIANAPHMSARNRAIGRLAASNPDLHTEFLNATREVEGFQHFIHASDRYPLTSFGRLNSAPLFAELSRSLLALRGMVGLIVPTGIATDSFNQYFFQDLMQTESIAALHSFENEEFIFPAVHHATKFCLLSLTGRARASKSPDFVFFARQVSQLSESERHFSLDLEVIRLLNPNTRTCPIFRTRRDAEITKGVYRRVPVLVNKNTKDGNPWGFEGMLMFMMNTASSLFHTREELEAKGYELLGSQFQKGQDCWLPLYEAKMIHQFDHRFGTYEGQTEAQANQGKLPELGCAQHGDPFLPALPRYWVAADEVDKRLGGRWSRGWLLGWRDITSAVTTRTVIASVIPRVGVGNNLPLMLLAQPQFTLGGALSANLAAFVYDFVARQKTGGTHMNFFIFEQLPVLPPFSYSVAAQWSRSMTLEEWLAPRVLELIHTAWEIEPFARDCGYDGPPFRWDENRRFLIRCELDAAFFHLYGIGRDDADYIMNTFPIVKRHDETAHGEYRTKRVILEIFEAMKSAMETGVPYRTSLDPPPGDARATHMPSLRETKS